MRFLLILIFPLIAYADPVAQVLKKLHHDPAAGFQEAERIYNSTKDNSTAARLATVLAFAPADQVKTAPYTYAQFAFMRDQTLTKELKVKLAKLAGEGLLNHSHFKQAASIFEKALAISDITQDEKEYFHYQIAWCDINLKAPQKAIARISSFALGCPECRLHKEMLTDLGKAFASLKPARESKGALAPLTNDEKCQAFIDGYVNEVQRSAKFSILENTKRFDNTLLLKEWLRFVFEDKRFADATHCSRVEALTVSPLEAWPRESAMRDIRLCAETKLKAKDPIPRALLAVYLKAEATAQLDLLLISSLWERAGDANEACKARLAAASLEPEAPARQALAQEVFLPSLIPVCRKGADVRVASLLDSPSVKITDAKWFNYYVTELSAIPAWREIFAARSVEDTTSRASNETLEQLILDERWPLAWRTNLWKAAPDVAALSPAVVTGMAREAFGTDQYATTLKEIESRLKEPRALVTLLKMRQDGGGAGYKEAHAIPDWQELSLKEQREILDRVATSENLENLLSDWSYWKLLLEKHPAVFQKITGFYAASNADLPEFKSPSAQESALMAIRARKENPSSEIPAKLLADSKPLNQSAKAHRLIQALEGKQLTLVSIEGALDGASRAIAVSRRHKWKLESLAQMNRRELKDTFTKFSASLKAAGGSDGEALSQLGEVVAGWEQKL